MKSADDSKRLAGMAQTRAKNVINLLQAPPPPGTAPDPAAGEVRRHRPRGAHPDRLQPVQHQRQADRRHHHPAVPGAALQPAAGAGRQAPANTVNFSDLLNLFAFRPDLNFGATIKALQERNLLQILAEPNLIAVEGKEASFLAGGSVPVSHHHHHADRRRHGPRDHRAVQTLRREAGFHPRP